MKQRRILILLSVIAFIALSLVFAMFFRDILREQVVNPIIGLFIQAQQVWRSLRSDLVWGFFVLFASLAAALIFPSVQQSLESAFTRPMSAARRKFSGITPDAHLNKHGGRLVFWYEEIEHMYEHHFLARFTVVELKKLILDEIAFKERCPTRHQAERWLNENPEKVPEVIWELFNPVVRDPAENINPRWNWLIKLLQSWGLVPPEISPVAVDRSLDAIIAYLEGRSQWTHPAPGQRSREPAPAQVPEQRVGRI